jgi:hypothetical protein
MGLVADKEGEEFPFSQLLQKRSLRWPLLQQLWRSKENDRLGTKVSERKKALLNGQMIFTTIFVQMIGLDFETWSLGLGNLVTAKTKQSNDKGDIMRQRG